ncbi:ExeA family protein [Vogesella sp. GCM10023246]|uniref:AAA family ATPase n=1 Tax=Vogesella oryzagri TaxID=3160864 RepID=A0ABV1M7E5_9NEIS
MYTHHYGFSGLPFSIAPDPHFLFMSQQHREALAHLMYGAMNNGGFVLLTGDIGTGKTTLCRCFLQQLPPECDVALIFNPKLNAQELLSTICEELHIPLPAAPGSKEYIDRINSYLLDSHAKGRTTLVIIDEAQNLDDDVLEQIRLLTNLETNQRKLLHIALLGQPELRDKLERPSLRQLSQRIVSRYHLGPLPAAEIADYIHHRLAIADCSRSLFPDKLTPLLYRYSGGIPRKLNLLCDRALLGCYVQGKTEVDKATLRTAAAEVFGPEMRHRRGQKLLTAGALLVSATALASTLLLYRQEAPAAARPPVATSSAHKVAAAPALPGPPAAVMASSLPAPATAPAANLALLQQWKLSASSGATDEFCQQAALAGLACLHGRGDLALLLQLNLPVLLHMQTAGSDGYLLLEQLHNDQATVGNGQLRSTVPSRLLQTAWDGSYQLLWRPPPGYQGPMAQGSRGLGVTWLWQRLEQQSGSDGTPRWDVIFDKQLEQRLREFQKRMGVPADGIAGPLTLILLAHGDASRYAPQLTVRPTSA